MLELLDNIIWNTLAGPHAGLSMGTAVARRYAPGFSPLLGFARPETPRFSDLMPYCQAGEQFYCSGWSGPMPGGWRLVTESTMFKMIWDGAHEPAEPELECIRLEAQHAAAALELAQFTQPGPFAIRTLELGEYFGCFEGSRLIAMAGERLHAGALREISGVCTHPDYRGRGLARLLTQKLVRRELHRGQTPFLHVMGENRIARDLYRAMGFREYQETVVRVVSVSE